MKEFDEEELLSIFFDLINIYSPTRNELEVSKYIVKFLENLGAQIYLDESYENYGGNCPTVFAKIKGNLEGQGVTFSAHMDVVEPNKESRVIFEDNIIKTDGNTTLGGDDKAGIAAILYSIKYIIDNNIDHQDIYTIFTPGEEIGMLGAKNIDWNKLYENMSPAKNVIVVDNAGKSMYVAYKAPTCTNYYMKAIGKTSHACLAPEAGVNAIKIISEIIYNMKSGRIDEFTTANVSEINSKFPTNVVPDQATASGEIRSHSYESVDKLLDEYEEIGNTIADKYHGKFEMQRIQQYPLLNSKDELAFANEFLEIYKSVGVDAQLQVIGGGSDANYLAGQGFNSIIIGVGMQKVHTTEEYLEVVELKNTTRAIIKYLSSRV